MEEIIDIHGFKRQIPSREEIRAEAIDECIEIVRNIPRYYYVGAVLDEMEQLKEHK